MDTIPDLDQGGNIHRDAFRQVLRKGLDGQFRQTVDQHCVEVLDSGGQAGQYDTDVCANLLGKGNHLEIHMDEDALDMILLFFTHQGWVLLAVQVDRDQAGGGCAAQYTPGLTSIQRDVDRVHVMAIDDRR